MAQMAELDKAFPDVAAAVAALHATHATISQFRRRGKHDLVAWVCEWAASTTATFVSRAPVGTASVTRADLGIPVELCDIDGPARCLFALRVLLAVAEEFGESNEHSHARRWGECVHACRLVGEGQGVMPPLHEAIMEWMLRSQLLPREIGGDTCEGMAGAHFVMMLAMAGLFSMEALYADTAVAGEAFDIARGARMQWLLVQLPPELCAARRVQHPRLLVCTPSVSPSPAALTPATPAVSTPGLAASLDSESMEVHGEFKGGKAGECLSIEEWWSANVEGYSSPLMGLTGRKRPREGKGCLGAAVTKAANAAADVLRTTPQPPSAAAALRACQGLRPWQQRLIGAWLAYALPSLAPPAVASLAAVAATAARQPLLRLLTQPLDMPVAASTASACALVWLLDAVAVFRTLRCDEAAAATAFTAILHAGPLPMALGAAGAALMPLRALGWATTAAKVLQARALNSAWACDTEATVCTLLGQPVPAEHATLNLPTSQPDDLPDLAELTAALHEELKRVSHGKSAAGALLEAATAGASGSDLLHRAAVAAVNAAAAPAGAVSAAAVAAPLLEALEDTAAAAVSPPHVPALAAVLVAACAQAPAPTAAAGQLPITTGPLTLLAMFAARTPQSLTAALRAAAALHGGPTIVPGAAHLFAVLMAPPAALPPGPAITLTASQRRLSSSDLITISGTPSSHRSLMADALAAPGPSGRRARDALARILTSDASRLALIEGRVAVPLHGAHLEEAARRSKALPTWTLILIVAKGAAVQLSDVAPAEWATPLAQLLAATHPRSHPVAKHAAAAALDQAALAAAAAGSADAVAALRRGSSDTSTSSQAPLRHAALLEPLARACIAALLRRPRSASLVVAAATEQGDALTKVLCAAVGRGVRTPPDPPQPPPPPASTLAATLPTPPPLLPKCTHLSTPAFAEIYLQLLCLLDVPTWRERSEVLVTQVTALAAHRQPSFLQHRTAAAEFAFRDALWLRLELLLPLMPIVYNDKSPVATKNLRHRLALALVTLLATFDVISLPRPPLPRLGTALQRRMHVILLMLMSDEWARWIVCHQTRGRPAPVGLPVGAAIIRNILKTFPAVPVVAARLLNTAMDIGTSGVYAVATRPPGEPWTQPWDCLPPLPGKVEWQRGGEVAGFVRGGSHEALEGTVRLMAAPSRFSALK
jgi:hypothetical protein